MKRCNHNNNKFVYSFQFNFNGIILEMIHCECMRLFFIKQNQFETCNKDAQEIKKNIIIENFDKVIVKTPELKNAMLTYLQTKRKEALKTLNLPKDFDYGIPIPENKYHLYLYSQGLKNNSKHFSRCKHQHLIHYFIENERYIECPICGLTLSSKKLKFSLSDTELKDFYAALSQREKLALKQTMQNLTKQQPKAFKETNIGELFYIFD